MKTLGIHGKAINELDKETFIGVPSLETLDLSYCGALGFEWIRNILGLNSSLENLKKLDLTSIYSMFPVTLDTPIIDALAKRRVRSLNMSGIALENLSVDIKAYENFCNFIEVINMSDIIYTGSGFIFFESGSDNLTVPMVPCLSVKHVDLSGLYLIDAAILWETDIQVDMNIDLKLFPFLETFFIDRLVFRAPEKSISFNGNHLKCSPCNFYNLKRVYLRGNHIKWFNASCDDCGNITLTHIELSSNEMEYISPALMRDLVSLEEINLGDNELHFMERFIEFEDLFATLQNLKTLILCKNKFKIIPKLLFHRNINLEYLDLSLNRLMTVSFSLKSLSKLKYLDLKQNQLRVLSATDYVHLSQFLQKRLDYNVTFSVDLTGNSFICTCEGYQLIYLIYAYVIPKLDKGQTLTCETSTNQHIKIDHNALYVSRHHCNEGDFIVTTTLLSFCLLVAILSTGVLLHVFLRRQHRHRIRDDLLNWFKTNRHINKYFIHIIYCSKDDMFVQNHVVPVLADVFEQVIGLEEDNLISLGYREYTLGRYIACEGDACIRQSFSVLFMLTNHSCICARCKSELQMAVHLNKPIAVLSDENVERELIPLWLRTCTMSGVTATFVRIGDVLTLKPSKLRFFKAFLDRVASSVNEI